MDTAPPSPPPQWQHQGILAGDLQQHHEQQLRNNGEQVVSYAAPSPQSRKAAGLAVAAPPTEAAVTCPRCQSSNTKFCYYNNYCLSQPRYFCKTCRRYWTQGGSLRNIPIGGASRKHQAKRSSSSSSVDHRSPPPTSKKQLVTTTTADVAAARGGQDLNLAYNPPPPYKFSDQVVHQFLNPGLMMMNNYYYSSMIPSLLPYHNNGELGMMKPPPFSYPFHAGGLEIGDEDDDHEEESNVVVCKEERVLFPVDEDVKPAVVTVNNNGSVEQATRSGGGEVDCTATVAGTSTAEFWNGMFGGEFN